MHWHPKVNTKNDVVRETRLSELVLDFGDGSHCGTTLNMTITGYRIGITPWLSSLGLTAVVLAESCFGCWTTLSLRDLSSVQEYGECRRLRIVWAMTRHLGRPGLS